MKILEEGFQCNHTLKTLEVRSGPKEIIGLMSGLTANILDFLVLPGLELTWENMVAFSTALQDIKVRKLDLSCTTNLGGMNAVARGLALNKVIEAVKLCFSESIKEQTIVDKVLDKYLSFGLTFGEESDATGADFEKEMVDKAWEMYSFLMELFGEGRENLFWETEIEFWTKMSPYFDMHLQSKNFDKKNKIGLRPKTEKEEEKEKLFHIKLKKERYLEAQDFVAQAAALIARDIRRHPTLTELVIYNNRITPKALVSLVENLQENECLRILNLTKNEIGDEGAMVLSELLAVNNTLTEINLEGTQISDQGVSFMMRALRLNKNLQLESISLLDNNIGDEGTFAIGEFLETNPNLKTLKVSCRIIDDGAKNLGKALAKNTHLQNLILSLNVSSVLTSEKRAKIKQMLIEIARGLVRNTTLTTLTLRGFEEISSEEIEEIFKGTTVKVLSGRSEGLSFSSFGFNKYVKVKEWCPIRPVYP